MKWRSLKFLLFAMFFLNLKVLNVSANEGAKEKGSHDGGGEHGAAAGGGEHGEAKTEEGGQGGGENAPSVPWAELETRIQTLEAKIQSKKQSLKTLIEEKEHLSEKSPHLKKITQEIGRTDRELRELLDEYEKNLTILKYRFPERHAKGGRKYDRNDTPKVDDLEKAIGLDGKLNKSIKKMRSQYPAPPHLKKASEPERKKIDSEKPSPGSIEEAPPILMKK